MKGFMGFVVKQVHQTTSSSNKLSAAAGFHQFNPLQELFYKSFQT